MKTLLELRAERKRYMIYYGLLYTAGPLVGYLVANLMPS